MDETTFIGSIHKAQFYHGNKSYVIFIVKVCEMMFEIFFMHHYMK